MGQGGGKSFVIGLEISLIVKHKYIQMVKVDCPDNSSRGGSIMQAVKVMHPGNPSRGRSSIREIHRMIKVVHPGHSSMGRSTIQAIHYAVIGGEHHEG
eukprot:4752421-Karenia_brevis.AAC.1